MQVISGMQQQIQSAAEQGANVVHFPEYALCGYPGKDFESWDEFNWEDLKAASFEICAQAAAENVWVLFGSAHRLSGSNLPPLGRIAGIVDCYDAMTTKTSYSPALAAYDAARELNEMRDQQFHGEVVEQFLHTIGMFPTGSIVELSNGSAGLVLEQNRNNPLQPKVLILMDAKGKELKKPRILNAKEWHGRGIWIAKGHEHGAFGIDPMDYFN